MLWRLRWSNRRDREDKGSRGDVSVVILFVPEVITLKDIKHVDHLSKDASQVRFQKMADEFPSRSFRQPQLHH